MIKSLKQAIEVQQRRADAGKPGIAKAVRRWARRKGENMAVVQYWVKSPEVEVDEAAS